MASSVPEPDATFIACIQRAADVLSAARDVLFITGAGVSAESAESAESGLPTYRGIGGLYNRGVTEEGVTIEDALSGRMLRTDPALCWKYIRQIEEACRGALPNRAHHILARFEQRFDRCVILTQNVDGFHTHAGSTDVIAIHGDIHHLRCTACRWTRTVADYADLAPVPSCPDCASLVRPAVVLFGEVLAAGDVERLDREQARGFDAVVSIGTTSVFPYIAGPVLAAIRTGVPTIEINPARSEVSHLVGVRLESGAVDALEAICRCLGAARQL